MPPSSCTTSWPGSRIASPLVTDGHRMYLEAVEAAFGSAVDFAQLIKEFKAGPPDPDHRYSPQPCARQVKAVITGNLESTCMAAGVTDRLWSVEDMIALLPDRVTGKKRGPYKIKAAA